MIRTRPTVHPENEQLSSPIRECPGAMDSPTTDFRDSNFDGDFDVPRPLQIVKGMEKRECRGTRREQAGRERSCSLRTTGSEGSGSAMFVADRPLTITKRRNNYATTGTRVPAEYTFLCSSNAGEARVAGSLQDSFHTQLFKAVPNANMANRQHTAINLLGGDESMRRPQRHSPLTKSVPFDDSPCPYSLSKGHEARYTRQQSFEDSPPPRPSTACSQQVRSQKSLYCREYTPSQLDGPRSRPLGLSRALPSSIQNPNPLDRGPNPYVLAPKVTVTPECKTLDDGLVTFWAAVQVSTQLCRPNDPDEVGPNREDGMPLGRGRSHSGEARHVREQERRPGANPSRYFRIRLFVWFENRHHPLVQ